jgi:oxidase EvaA
MLHHRGDGLNGFIMQRIFGVLHFLVRACMYPGNCELFELGATVARSHAAEYFGKPGAPEFLDLFQNPPREWIRHESIQSEEGGRFYHYRNRYVILEVPPDHRLDLPENFCWMTLRQVGAFVRHGYFNIEARNLLACLDISGAAPLEGEPV